MVHAVWEKKTAATWKFSWEKWCSQEIAMFYLRVRSGGNVLKKAEDTGDFTDKDPQPLPQYSHIMNIYMWYVTSHKDVKNTPKWNKFQNNIYIIIPSLWNNDNKEPQQLY